MKIGIIFQIHLPGKDAFYERVRTEVLNHPVAKKNDISISTRLLQESESLSDAVEAYIRKAGLEAILIASSGGAASARGSDIPILELDVSNYGSFRRDLFGGLSVAIRRINILSNIYRDMKFRKIFLLPRKNFKLREVYELNNVFVRHFSDKSFDFLGEFQSKLSSIRQTERPKSTTNYSSKYLFDGGMYFQYGYERHAQIEYRGGKHNFGCLVAAHVRFSIIYDNGKHYNVSDGKNGSLKGIRRPICHDDDDYDAPECQHLNIFPNDFIA